jgi:shikimate dehydrogenase
VLGRPIAHSLSPALHTAAYTALGLDWEYSAIECGVEELPRVLAERAGWAGFCCTMPLKRAVLALADEASALARAVGAGNTLTPRAGGGWRADNTDVTGIVATLGEGAVDPRRVTVLGAGGTAQAAMGALAEFGVPECAVLVRNPDRTAELRATAETLGVAVSVAPLRPDAAELGADLVISTLPRGAADPLAGHSWRAGQAVLDVVYDPWPTALASAVARSGGTALSGGLMLLHQAAVQVELMTGRPAPVAAMRAALRAVAPAAGV